MQLGFVANVLMAIDYSFDVSPKHIFKVNQVCSVADRLLSDTEPKSSLNDKELNIVASMYNMVPLVFMNREYVDDLVRNSSSRTVIGSPPKLSAYLESTIKSPPPPQCFNRCVFVHHPNEARKCRRYIHENDMCRDIFENDKIIKDLGDLKKYCCDVAKLFWRWQRQRQQKQRKLRRQQQIDESAAAAAKLAATAAARQLAAATRWPIDAYIRAWNT